MFPKDEVPTLFYFVRVRTVHQSYVLMWLIHMHITGNFCDIYFHVTNFSRQEIRPWSGLFLYLAGKGFQKTKYCHKKLFWGHSFCFLTWLPLCQTIKLGRQHNDPKWSILFMKYFDSLNFTLHSAVVRWYLKLSTLFKST